MDSECTNDQCRSQIKNSHLPKGEDMVISTLKNHANILLVTAIVFALLLLGLSISLFGEDSTNPEYDNADILTITTADPE